MKKRSSKTDENKMELKPEYIVDYSKARRNPYAKAARKANQRVVMLDEDVSKVFPNSDAVNAALRAIISAFPSAPKPAKQTPPARSGSLRARK